MSGTPVFDAHIHIQPWSMLRPDVRQRMWAGRSDRDTILEIASQPTRLLRFLDEQHIDHACLINYVSPDVMGFTEETNTWISNFVRGHEDRLVAFGSVHPRRTQDPTGDVERLADLGIRGLKLHPPHQLVQPNEYLDGPDTLARIYERAATLGLPLMVHTGTSIFPGARNRYADPMTIDDVALDFPELRIILAHGGRPLFMETCVFLVRRHPNVFMDVSGIPPRSLLQYFPRLEALADKVLWGTDWPGPGVPEPRRNVEDFLSLSLAPQAKRRILYETAAKLFGMTTGPEKGPRA